MTLNILNELPDASKEHQLVVLRDLLSDVVLRIKQNHGGKGVYLLNLGNKENDMILFKHHLPKLCILSSIVSQAHARVCLKNEHNLWSLLIEDYFSDNPKYAVLMNSQVDQLLESKQLLLLLDLLHEVMTHIKRSSCNKDVCMLNIGSVHGIQLRKRHLPKLCALIGLLSNACVRLSNDSRREHTVGQEQILLKNLVWMNWRVIKKEMTLEVLNELPDATTEHQLLVLRDLLADVIARIEHSPGGNGVYLLNVGSKKNDLMMYKQNLPKLRALASIISQAHVRASLGTEHQVWCSLIRDYFSDKPKYAVLMNSQVNQLLTSKQLLVLLDLLRDVRSRIERSGEGDGDGEGACVLRIGSDNGVQLCKRQLPKLRSLIAQLSNADVIQYCLAASPVNPNPKP